MYKRLLVFVKPYIPRLALGLLCMIIAASCYMVVPWLIRDVVDEVLMEKNLFKLNLIVVAIVFLFFIRGIAVYGQTYSMAFVGQRVVIDLRESIYRKLMSLSQPYFDRNKTGVIMSKLTNDVTALQTAIVDNLVTAVTEGVMLIASLVSMIYLDWKLTLLTFIIVPLVLGVTNVFGKRLRLAGHEVQGRIADITAFLQETISSIRVVRSFVRERFEVDRFNVENVKNFRAAMRATRLTSMLTPMVEFSAAIAIAVIIWYGGYSVIEGEISSGSLIAFLIYAINLSNPVKRLSQVYGTIQKSMAAGERIVELLDSPVDVEEKANAIALAPVKGNVVFHDVSFSYGDKPALDKVSIEAKEGEIVALVGPSGAGKSTVINLIPRFYDITNGAITIDGFDVRDVTLDSLRNQVGIVPQETQLFNMSIRENILYGRLDATEEEVYEAAKAANALEFIEKMPDGFDTMVGERGSSLSGGQRQRIAIARAILKNPRILILDEATSALDTESEKIVQEALERLMQGRTAIVIAHRLSTIRNAHKIYVLQQGRVVEVGSHEELLTQNGVYQHLHTVQGEKKES